MLSAAQIDTEKPADQPLTEAEQAEMAQHLRFLSQHRKNLKLRVNAQEDLLLNGAKPPEHRGTCVHLLSKVDLASVEAALPRYETSEQRLKLLAGVVRFSGDVGVLLLYLEELAGVASKGQAAGAFSRAVEKIDFEQVSEARTRRVLDLVATIFDGHERSQVLFGLLSSDSFRAAFDASTGGMPDALAETFVPLRAVHEVVLEGGANRHGDEALSKGVAALLSAPRKALSSLPLVVRERLLLSAVSYLRDRELADKATGDLLATLPEDSTNFSKVGIVRAADLLSAGRDDEARDLLKAMKRGHPDFRLPIRWLEALESPRVGRYALIEKKDKGRRREEGKSRPRRQRGRLREGFRLDDQRAAWLVLSPLEEAGSVEDELRLRRERPVFGMLPALGVAERDDGSRLIALPSVGWPLHEQLLNRKYRREHGWFVAMQAVQLLASLHRAGLELPDVAPERFVVESGHRPALWLADASRLRAAEGETAEPIAQARELVEAMLAGLGADVVAPSVRERVETASTLSEMLAVVASRA
ncbi:MAG: hypothetical protein AAF533_15425 [Acidobacteriota bacterium]